jgi:hypothetical protein
MAENAGVKSLFGKKKGKKKTNTLNTNAIPTSNQHIDAEALSTKTTVANDDGWADKTEKKKVVVSSGKSLGDIQAMKTSHTDKEETAAAVSKDVEQPKIITSKTGWGNNKTDEKDEDEKKNAEENVEKEAETPVVEEKFKPFQARRPMIGAPKPNTESTTDFPTLDTAVAETSKVVPSASASSTASSLSPSSESSASARPKLALKPRTAPLPEAPPTTPAEKGPEPPKPVEATTGTKSDAPRSTNEPSWRGQSAVPQGDSNSDRERDTPSSWRGQSAVPQGGSNTDRERDTPSSWRGQSAVPQGGSSNAERDPPSWRGQSATLPPADTGGIKFGASSNGERPKLALKKRTVD